MELNVLYLYNNTARSLIGPCKPQHETLVKQIQDHNFFIVVDALQAPAKFALVGPHGEFFCSDIPLAHVTLSEAVDHGLVSLTPTFTAFLEEVTKAVETTGQSLAV